MKPIFRYSILSVLFSFSILADAWEDKDSAFLNCIHFDTLYAQNDSEEEVQLRSLFESFKNAYDTDYQSEVIDPSPTISVSDSLPNWAENDPDVAKEYYKLHAETWFDRTLGYIASRLGVIIHGNFDTKLLAEHLSFFDIQNLLRDGPYHHPTLSIQAQKLILDSLKGLPRVIDVHIHNFGYDEGNYLNPRTAARHKAKWKDYFTFLVLRYAAGMSSPIGSTQAARERIHLYASHFPKLNGYILPIHQAFTIKGEADWGNTGSFLKNRSALITVGTFNHPNSELFPAVSVHPFDPKWEIKLLSAYYKGIRLVKWMPPQSIPPDSALLTNYYKILKELDMTLIAHSGPEHAIPTTEKNKQWQDWGNPLRFRNTLKHGVNVILAHSGHKDLIPDLDDPNQTLIEGYKLFIRLAQEAYAKNLTGEWTGKVYGDLAAVTTHYGPDFVKEIMRHIPEKGIRFVYGSDYPYTNLVKPGMDAYDLFAEEGLLSFDKVKPLKEIRAWNPLLANFIFTRQLELTYEEKKIQFPTETFTGEFSDAPLFLFNP